MDLSKLKQLFMNHTYLTSIPEWVYDLPDLEVFEAEHCYIRDVKSIRLPPDDNGVIRRSGIFPSLTTFYLEGNPLTPGAIHNYLAIIAHEGHVEIDNDQQVERGYIAE